MAEFPQGCCVTFGGSGGLGLAIVRRMAELGADQVATYRNRREELADLKPEIEAAGRELLIAPCDVTDLESVRDVLNAACAKFGSVHSVINATGLAYEVKALADHDPQAFFDVIETDVIGFFNIAKAAVGLMRAKGGAIVTVGTAGIANTIRGNTLSAIPKTAVARMVEFLAYEEGHHGIRVNMVGAGLYNAGMSLLMEKEGKTGGVSLEDVVQSAIPLKRFGKAEELAEVVGFLTTARASYVTGQIIHVDGGLSA